MTCLRLFDKKKSHLKNHSKHRKVIEENAKSKDPFFLYMPFQSVHFPVEVPKIYEDLYPHEKDVQRRQYLGMITAMDEAVGRIVTKLKETGQYENTIFAFSSDNGGLPNQGANNYPFRGWKMSLWEGGVRSAGFIAGPGVKKGAEYENLFHVSDWMPTLLDAVNVKRSIGKLPLDGVSHWSAIRSKDNETPRETVLLNIDRDWYWDTVSTKMEAII